MNDRELNGPFFVIYGKGVGFEYSVRTKRGEAICTCAYNPGSNEDKQKMAALIATALNAFTTPTGHLPRQETARLASQEAPK